MPAPTGVPVPSESIRRSRRRPGRIGALMTGPTLVMALVMALAMALVVGLGSAPAAAAPTAPNPAPTLASAMAPTVSTAAADVFTAAGRKPRARTLTRAKRQVRRVAQRRHDAFGAIRDDVRLPALPSGIATEIGEAARRVQNRIDKRVMAAERARRVARVRKLRAAIAAEDPAPLRARIADEHAAVLADVNCGVLGRALENNEDGLLGPVVALVNALCL